MRRKKIGLALLATAMVVGALPATADVSGLAPILPNGAVTDILIADGNLTDWGVETPGDFEDFNDSGVWTPDQGSWAFEDSVLNTYVGPGVGGQDFDAEALYTGYDVEKHTLYVALVTGFNLEGQYSYPRTYYAGDIFIDFGNYIPQNGQSPENSTDINSSGSSVDYDLNAGQSWDLAFDLSGATGDGPRNAVRNFGIDYSPTPNGAGYESGPLEALNGTVDGQAGFNYTANFGSSRRNLYEFSYVLDPLNALHLSWMNSLLYNDSGAFGWTVHWTMSCGNDYLDAAAYLDQTTILVPPVVPVPAAAPLGLVGMIALGLFRKVRSKKS